jgi:hypothetical protein
MRCQRQCNRSRTRISNFSSPIRGTPLSTSSAWARFGQCAWATTTERSVTKYQAAFCGFGSEATPNMTESLANKSLERTVSHRGRTVRAFAVGARAGAQWRMRPAVQQDR